MPVGQAVHVAAFAVLENWPAVQFVHVVSAVTEQKALLYMPAGHVVQGEHAPAPEADQVPVAQGAAVPLLKHASAVALHAKPAAALQPQLDWPVIVRAA